MYLPSTQTSNRRGSVAKATAAKNNAGSIRGSKYDFQKNLKRHLISTLSTQLCWDSAEFQNQQFGNPKPE
jgi:hypothetical protein